MRTTRSAVRTVVLLVMLGGCGDGSERPAATAGASAGGDAKSASTVERGQYDRASFVLCPALQPHRDELASIVGFEADPDRPVAGIGSECIVHGADNGFARVALAPAIVRSVSMQAEGYEAPTRPAPELGSDAVFVDAQSQPHVIFPLGGLIVDVDAENVQTPSRETMLQLATRVREILREANGA